MKTKQVFHWFWAWQDEKEEAWLEAMASQGWHLQSASAFCNYSMVAGEPREMAYRLDFFTDSKNQDNYLKIFEDAGWEHVSSSGSWQYFRKPKLDGEVPEIFTDQQSKVVKYQRVLAILVILNPLYAVILTRLNRAEGWLYEAATFIAFLLMILYIVAILKLIGRISQLKRTSR